MQADKPSLLCESQLADSSKPILKPLRNHTRSGRLIAGRTSMQLRLNSTGDFKTSCTLLPEEMMELR
jgi:hypothetical protein